MTWYLVSIALSVILVVIFRYQCRRKRILSDKIPGPDGLYIIGMLPLLLQGGEKILISGEKLYRKFEKSLFKLKVLNLLFIVITQPEDIESVLTNPKLVKKSKPYSVLQESIMGQGIFSNGDIKKWKHNRKIVIGGFNFSVLKSFIPIFHSEANVLSEMLRRRIDSKSNECDISKPIAMATMEIIGRTSLGIKFNAQYNGDHEYIENLLTVMKIWEYRVLHPWYLSKILFRFSSLYHVHKRCQKLINEFIDEIIKKKMDELSRNANIGEKLETNDGQDVCRKMKNFIDVLFEHCHDMSHEQIRDEIVTIMIGGQETTAMANASTIFMLAHHQDIQNKVFEELQTIFIVGDPNRSPTFEDLQQMEYLERVIKESLRLFPPLPVFSRALDEEMKIGDYLCPAGSFLVISPLVIHTNSQYYKEPNKFNPDNFLPDACRSRHPYAYIPFSAGYRNCIGIKYSMMQMKTIISTLVRQNRFLPSERCPNPSDLRVMCSATLKFVNGCHVKILPRT